MDHHVHRRALSFFRPSSAPVSFASHLWAVVSLNQPPWHCLWKKHFSCRFTLDLKFHHRVHARCQVNDNDANFEKLLLVSEITALPKQLCSVKINGIRCSSAATRRSLSIGVKQRQAFHLIGMLPFCLDCFNSCVVVDSSSVSNSLGRSSLGFWQCLFNNRHAGY